MMRWYKFRNTCVPVTTPMKQNMVYVRLPQELVNLRIIISIIKRYHKPLSFRVHKGSNIEGFIFRRRPRVPRQTVKNQAEFANQISPNFGETGTPPTCKTAKNRYSYNRISLHGARDLVQVITSSR